MMHQLIGKKKYLIYFQDLGGSRYLESVLNEFVGVFNHSDTHFFFHELAYPIKENLKSKFHESNFENNEIKDLRNVIKQKENSVIGKIQRNIDKLGKNKS